MRTAGRAVSKRRPANGDRQGVALMLALWVLVVLGAVSLQILAQVRARVDTATLARTGTVARYAAESGVEEARIALEGLVAGAETPEARARILETLQSVLDFGQARVLGTARYQVAVEDLNARVDLNLSSPEVLLGLFEQFVPVETAAALVRAIQGTPDARSLPLPLMHVEELARMPDVGDSLAAAVAPYVTVRGDGPVNVNSAPYPVLAAVPQLGPLAARALVDEREAGTVLASKVALASALSERGGDAVDAQLPDLTTFPRRILVVSRGWEEGSPLTHEVQAVLELVASPFGGGPRVRLRGWSETGS